MAWLSLDTSTPYLSLALVERRGDVFHAVREAQVGPHVKQSELLPGAVESFLEGIVPRSLDGIVAGLGPGSFTGLRVGLAFAKGLAYAARLPLAGASSLAAVACEAPPGSEARLLAALALSRKGELYVGRYRRSGARVTASQPEVALSLEACAQLLRAEPDVLALGPAVAAHRQALLALGAPASALQDGPDCPRACHLVALATLPVAYDFQRLAALEPHYIGASGAERHSKQD